LAQAAKNKVIDKTRQFKTQKYNVDREENLDDYVGRKEGRESGSRVRALHSREPTPSTAASLRERWNQLLANSSERDRQILRLRIKGWTFEAISASLQIDRETARRTIQRLIQRISE
jgi:RNA polymerase sigma factor (sigma-70 family)